MQKNCRKYTYPWKKLLVNEGANLKCFIYNAQSICNKTNGVIEFLHEKNCDVCCINESWLVETDKAKVAEIKDLGYNIKVQPRRGRGGGICILYKPYIDIKKCNIKKYSTFESLEVTVKGNGELLRISTIYRTGKMNLEMRELFFLQINEYCETLLSKTGKSIINGDFNIHVEKTELESTEFIDNMECNGYTQVVRGPTHRDGSTLDLIFLRKNDFNVDDLKCSLNVYELICSVGSDHSFIEISIPFKNPTIRKHQWTKYRNLKSINVGNFRTALKLELASKTTNDLDPDGVFKHLNTSLRKVIDEQAPLIKKKIINRKNDFTTPEIIRLRRARRKAERNYRSTKREEDHILYKDLVNQVSKAVKTSRKNFYSDTLSRCKNGRETFQIVNKLLDKATTKGILPVHHDEVKLCNDFQKFFHEKIEKIRTVIVEDKCNSSIITIYSDEDKINVRDELNKFSILTVNELKLILEKISMKYCDLDPIPTWLFMSCIEEIMPFLMFIINGALQSGNFLKALKAALVKPNLKKENLDSDIYGNYRPVSNISFLSKVLENCILLQITKHLDENNLWSKYQSAYRKFHSCETAIAKIMDDILSEKDQKNGTILLFLDLSAAFDTVDHAILLTRLKNKFGITGKVLQMIESYLTDRKFYITIADKKSKGMQMKYGVPQGSILGPILFILYTQELETIAIKQGFKIHIFADDTQLYITFKSDHPETSVPLLEKCLKHIKEWMQENFLMLNEEKTQLLIIPSKKTLNAIDIDLTFAGNPLESLTVAKNLGVYFDNNLDMNRQIKHLCSTGYSALRNLWSITGSLTKELKIQLVHCFILSRIDYCNICLYGINKGQIYQLQKLMNSAVRLIFNITGERYREHIKPYMKELHFLTIDYRIKYKVTLLAFKCINNIAPAYLQELLVMKQGLQSLRNADDYFLLNLPNIPKTSNGTRRFSYAAPLEWNQLPYDLRTCSQLETFKRNLKTHYFQLCFGDL